MPDLTRFLSERELLELCLESVSALHLTTGEMERLKMGEFRPQMLLTLLAFAYTKRRYASEDIEWAAVHDRTIRYICAHTQPDYKTIRHFRKLHRALIEQCLRYVFEHGWRRAFGPVKTDFTFYQWWDSCLERQARAVAGERLELAIIADTAAAEW